MDKVTIKIPRMLYEKIRTVTEESGFSSPTEFIVYVLRDVLGEQLAKKDATDEKNDLSQKEISAIKKRLRNLGYL